MTLHVNSTNRRRLVRGWGLRGVAIAVLLGVLGAADLAAQGISQEEYHQSTPPPPVVQEARCFDDRILLKWKAPPQIGVPRKTGYDPEVAFYRVYRIERNHKPVLIGRTEDRFFLLRMPANPGKFSYAISAVQRSGQESPLSLEIEVPAFKN